MIKGIIIELHENYGVILTDEGLFMKIKRFGTMMEGQPVYLTEEDIIMESKFDNDHLSHVVDMKHSDKPAKIRKLNTAFLGVIAASMLIIAISATWFFATANTIYTAVIVDINPSIELDLNKNNKVVKLVALNDDALDLDLAALKGKQIDDAIELLVSDAGAKGYFIDDDGYYVLVTTVAMKDQSVEALQAKLLAKFEDSNVLQRTSLALTTITPAQLNLAKQNQVPAGLVMIASSGSDTTVKEFFKIEDNVKAFEDSGVVVRGSAVDSISSATSTVESTSGSSSTGTSSDDSVSEMTQDLKERLIKLKGVVNPSVSIKAFIVKADAYFATGTGDLRTLTTEAKSLWDGVKGEDDDSDDDSNDDSGKDDDSDDDSNDDSGKDDDSDDDSNDDSTQGTTSPTQSTTSSTQSTTSSTQNTTGTSDDTIAHQRADLSERLLKLKGVSNPTDTIKAFIVKADAYFASGTGNLSALTVEAKLLWDSVKDADDDSSDDDSTEADSTEADSTEADSSDDDSSDDDSDNSNDD